MTIVLTISSRFDGHLVKQVVKFLWTYPNLGGPQYVLHQELLWVLDTMISNCRYLLALIKYWWSGTKLLVYCLYKMFEFVFYGSRAQFSPIESVQFSIQDELIDILHKKCIKMFTSMTEFKVVIQSAPTILCSITSSWSPNFRDGCWVKFTSILW